MKLPKKQLLLGLVVVFGAMQLVRPAKFPISPSGADDFLAKYPPSAEVRSILAAACLDCHSDSTRYPWYAGVQPVGSWLAGHVRNGRTALNFSTLAALPATDITHQLDAAVDTVNHAEMPPVSYRLLHADARLSETEKIELTVWLQGLADKIGAGTGKKVP